MRKSGMRLFKHCRGVSNVLAIFARKSHRIFSVCEPGAQHLSQLQHKLVAASLVHAAHKSDTKNQPYTSKSVAFTVNTVEATPVIFEENHRLTPH
jgi:hypothetical protein